MKTIRHNVGLSWASQALYIAVQLLKVPILYRIFEGTARDTWFLMVSMMAFVAFLEMGFTSSFVRFYARSFGAHDGPAQAALQKKNIPNFPFDVLAGTSKRLFLWLGLFAFLIAFPGGLLYLRTVGTFSNFTIGIIAAWGLLALSQGIIMNAFQYSSVLQGRGYVGIEALIRAGGSLVSVLLLAPAIFFRSSLSYVAFTELARGIAMLILFLYYCKKYVPEYFRVKPFFETLVFKKLWLSSALPFLGNIGASLFYNTDAMFIASWLSIGMVSDYYNTNQAVTQLYGICFAVMTSAFPALLMTFGSGYLVEFRALYYRVMKYAVMLYAILGSYLLFSGKTVFQLWLGQGHFVGYPILILLILYFFLETQNAIWLNAQFSVEKYPMLWMCWLSAGLRYGLTIFLLRETHLHLLAIIVGKFLALALAISLYGAYFCLKTLHVWPLNLERLKKGLALYWPVIIFPAIGYATRMPFQNALLNLIIQTLIYFGIAFFAAYFLMENDVRQIVIGQLKKFRA